jgi:hypothetical protein
MYVCMYVRMYIFSLQLSLLLLFYKIINTFFFTHREGSFAKLREVTINLVMSFRPSVRLSVFIGQLGYHWKKFHQVLNWRVFRNSVEKIQF